MRITGTRGGARGAHPVRRTTVRATTRSSAGTRGRRARGQAGRPPGHLRAADRQRRPAEAAGAGHRGGPRAAWTGSCGSVPEPCPRSVGGSGRAELGGARRLRVRRSARRGGRLRHLRRALPVRHAAPGTPSAAADARRTPRPPSRRTGRRSCTCSGGRARGRIAAVGLPGEHHRPDALLGPADIRELAAGSAYGPRSSAARTSSSTPTRSAGSCAPPEVRPDDVVVEVGPGLGSLTLALLEAADRVTAVEIDDVLAAALPGHRRRPGCRTAPTGSRWSTPTRCRSRSCPAPPPTALVANLPYNVAVPVLLHMLETFPTIERTLVMVQAEVADRLAARPGHEGLRRALGQGQLVRGGQAGRLHRPERLLARPERRLRPGVARPPRPSRSRPPRAGREVFAVVDAAFAQRRKTLRAALAGWAGSAPAAEAALVAAGVSPQARGER